MVDNTSEVDPITLSCGYMWWFNYHSILRNQMTANQYSSGIYSIVCVKIDIFMKPHHLHKMLTSRNLLLYFKWNPLCFSNGKLTDKSVMFLALVRSTSNSKCIHCDIKIEYVDITINKFYWFFVNLQFAVESFARQNDCNFVAVFWGFKHFKSKWKSALKLKIDLRSFKEN